MKTEPVILRRRILIVLLCILPVFPLAGKPAVTGRVVLSQPDGTRFTAILSGDEFSRSLTDLAGHNIMQDSDGWYCYARYLADGRKLSSGYPVGAEAPSAVLTASSYVPYAALSLESSRRRRGRDASSGDDGSLEEPFPRRRGCIVIPASFSDVPLTYGHEDFAAMVCGTGYSRGGATGSVAEYFRDQLSGCYELDFYVAAPVVLPQTRRFYGANSGESRDVNAAQAVMDACSAALEAGEDFSRFDADGDGRVDCVFILVAGRDEADGGGEDCIWSHQHRLSYQGLSFEIAPGLRIDDYAISTEIGGYYDAGGTMQYDFCSIGTFCHEYGHVLGLPDTYDTDGAGSGGRADGLWLSTGLMDGGNANNRGRTPPHFSAVDYDALGIGSPRELAPGAYALEPIGEGRRFLKAQGPTEGEYYLFECRKETGWDTYIGGSGLAVYHIDRSARAAGRSDYYAKVLTASQRWALNEVNCRPDHQCARMVAAWPEARAYDEAGYYVGRSSMVFFPYRDNDSFGPSTVPPYEHWDGSEAPFLLSDIVWDGEVVTFRSRSTANLEIPEVVASSEEVFQDAAILRWESSMAGSRAEAHVRWGESDAQDHEVTVTPYEDGKYALRLEGLRQRTSYKVSISFVVDEVEGKVSEVKFTTRSLYDGYPFIYLAGSGRNPDGSFLPGAELPLVVYNLKETAEVRWLLGGTEIKPSADGYYHVVRPGLLRAEIDLGGAMEIIEKMIVVK